MANNNNIAIALLILALAAPAAVYAADHIVGGTSGWSSSGPDYSTWAAGETFVVGDNLVFNYGGSHSVSEVQQTDYTSCSGSNAVRTYTSGSTTIPLTATGNRYFICPTAGHCDNGMKLSINVLAGSGGTPPTTPTTPSTPTPTTPSTPTPTTPSTPTPTTPSTPTTPTATTSPPPPSPSGAPKLNHLMLPSLMLLLGAAVATMG